MLSDEYNDKIKREGFQKELIQSVYGIKMYVNSIKEDIKTMKMKSKDQKAIAAFKESISRKKD